MNEDTFLIRPETDADRTAIAHVHRLAFGGEAEAGLVEAVRGSDGFIPGLSLVAEYGGQMIGHILLSRIHIETGEGSVDALSLAPLAVLPGYQRQGVGSALVRRALEEARRQGHAAVLVLGHADYYPRFGFSAGKAAGVACPFGDAGPHWMALELVSGALEGVRGRAVYPPAFYGV
ncbi:MAG TPA: N-acetyltransferase [Anaerolineaceae bacterium]|jgi:putative acetyltransferase|nr:N-acetyltransferase [Anaerolineaceae bacterium]